MEHVTATFVGIGAVMILGGLFFAWTGARRARSLRRFNAAGTTVQAVVLELRRHDVQHTTTSNSHWFAPLVRFGLPDGRVVEAETMTGSNPAPARVGEVVLVRYDPDAPTRVNLAGGVGDGTMLGCVHVGLGIGLVGFGAVACVVGYLVSRLP